MKQQSLIKRAMLLASITLLAGISIQLNNKAHALFIDDPGISGIATPPDGAAQTKSSLNCSPIGAAAPCLPNGPDVQPYYAIGNVSGTYTYSYMTLAIYVKRGTPSVDILISNAAPDCHDAITDGTGLNRPDYSTTPSAPPTQYVLYGANGMISAKVSSGGGCAASITFNNISTNASTPMANPTNNLDGYFLLTPNVLPSAQEGENSFTASITAGGGAAGYVGGSGVVGFGYRKNNLNDGNFWNGETSFAPALNCQNYNNGSSISGTITYQDSDIAQKGWNSNMVFELQSQAVNSSGATAVPIGSWALVPGSRQTQGVNMGQNGTIVSNFPFQRDHRYRIVYANLGVRNTIRFDFSNGLDGIYANIFERPSVGFCNPQPNSLNSVCNGAITASIANPVVGQQTVLTVNIKNTGTTTWNSSFYMNQQAPVRSDPKRFVVGSVIGGNPTSFKYTLGARASPQTVNFSYRMYDDKGQPFGATCSINITWGNVPAQPSLAAECGVTVIKVPKASITSTWHPLPNVHAGVATPITNVPVAVVITESGTPNSYTYTTSVNISAGDGQTTVNTFDMWPAMLPHKSYDISLAVQGAAGGDSLTYNNDGTWFQPGGSMAGGPFWYGINFFGAADTVSDCLQPGPLGCVGPSPADLEPGQKNDFTYKVSFTNLTTKSWNTAGGVYSFIPHTGGGMVYVGPNPPNNSTDIGPNGDSIVTVTLPMRVDYTGSYWADFAYGGSPLALGSWDGSCASNPGGNTPHTYPYFQVTGGDIGSGGGFRSRNGSCGMPTDTPYISPSATGYDYAGGIRAFATPNQQRGAEAQFGVDSLGLIIGNLSGRVGFYSANGGIFANKSVPAFNAIKADGLYGYLNASPQAHCIDEFFTAKKKSQSLPDPGAATDVTSLAAGQWSHTGDLDLNGGTIAAGKQLTLFVDGNVTIHSPITYAPDWDPNNISSIPYFVLVVKGNITLDNSVTQLDGLYVAQPTNASDGRFNSCDPATLCNEQLVINGAVIAQQVNLLRVHGSVGIDIDQDNNGLCSPYPIPQCPPAEVINYVPSMIIGSADLLLQNDGAIVPSAIEGIFSLPPVF